MSLADALFNSRRWDKDENRTITQDNAVTSLVRELEAEASQRGLTVSRWQANGPSFTTTITWAVHNGPRPNRSGDLPKMPALRI